MGGFIDQGSATAEADRLSADAGYNTERMHPWSESCRPMAVIKLVDHPDDGAWNVGQGGLFVAWLRGSEPRYEVEASLTIDDQ